MQDFLIAWDYLGVFFGIIATGLGFPMPEELPVVIGGGLVHELFPTDFRWWRMLLACIGGVLVGDSCLYFIGRFWGIRLVQIAFIKKHLLTPARLVSISHNFDKYGVKILLFARLTPGIRAPIFVTAGITKLPWAKFLIADGIYAIPGVSLLFLLGYWFGDTVAGIVEAGESMGRSIVWLVLLVGIAGYFLYRHLRKPVVEGSPKEMPPVVGQVTNVVGQVTSALDQSLHTVKDKIMHAGEAKTSSEAPPQPPPNSPPSHPAGHGSASPWPGTPSAPPEADPLKDIRPKVKPVVIAGVVVALTGYFYFMYRLLRGRTTEPTPSEPPLVTTPPSANGQALTGNDPIPHQPASDQSR